MQIRKSWLTGIVILFLALCNYQLAKFTQRGILAHMPTFSYLWAIVIPWMLIALAPSMLTHSNSDLKWNWQKVNSNILKISIAFVILFIGLLVFSSLGITKYFHGVRYPIIFVLFTPIIEELIFRGYIYHQVEELGKNPVLWSSILFGLHHLQYFNYHFTTFAIFQITYTFALGLVLGRLRRDSDSIHPGLIAHILLNWATLLI